MRDAAIRRLGPAEPHPFPQHAGDLGDVGIGIGIVGAAPDDDKDGVLAILRRRGGDPLGGRGEQLGIDREVAAEPHLDTRICGHETVHFPRQVVLDVAGCEQHAGHGEDPPRAARHQIRQPLLDCRVGEFEIAGREILRRETPAQGRGGDLELTDRVGVAAAMTAQQHRGLGHPPVPCRLPAAAA